MDRHQALHRKVRQGKLVCCIFMRSVCSPPLNEASTPCYRTGRDSGPDSDFVSPLSIETFRGARDWYISPSSLIDDVLDIVIRSASSGKWRSSSPIALVLCIWLPLS